MPLSLFVFRINSIRVVFSFSSFKEIEFGQLGQIKRAKQGPASGLPTRKGFDFMITSTFTFLAPPLLFGLLPLEPLPPPPYMLIGEPARLSYNESVMLLSCCEDCELVAKGVSGGVVMPPDPCC